MTTKTQKFSARGILLILVFKNQFSEILHYYWTTFTTVFLPQKEYKHYKFLEERNFIYHFFIVPQMKSEKFLEQLKISKQSFMPDTGNSKLNQPLTAYQI